MYKPMGQGQMYLDNENTGAVMRLCVLIVQKYRYDTKVMQ